MKFIPKVSVLMPVYNCARFLVAAIESILNQTFREYEFIIVDDGSTDNSLEIIKKYALIDDRIKVISKLKSGIVGALNVGLSVAQGNYIARMDGDDISFPNRLEKQVYVMETQNEIIALGTSVLFIDSVGLPLFTYNAGEKHETIQNELLKGNGGAMIHPSILFRKEALDKVGGYREKYCFIEDFDLYLRLCRIGRFGNLPEVLLKYRQHSGSVNYRENREIRLRLKQTILNQELSYYGLPQKHISEEEFQPKRKVEIFRNWSYNASQEGYKRAALKYSMLGVMLAPFETQSWKHLKLAFDRIKRRNLS